MPSVNDILSVAEALEKSPIIVVRDSCVAVRNRNATCRRCLSVCQANALNVSGNDLSLNTALCTGCGACTVACPTEALVSVAPTNTALLQAASQSMEANDGSAVIACARIASKRVADPARYAEVPCLSRVDETLLLSLAAQNAERVVLVDGRCETCKFREFASHCEGILNSARNLVAALGGEAAIERREGFPDELLVENAGELHGTTRRGFFSEAVGAAKETTLAAAKATVAEELGLNTPELSIGERLRVTETGTLPLIHVPRHEATINALDALGNPQVESIESRLFASVDIDVQRCNSCGMCALFCPTGALRRDLADEVGDPLRCLEFSASDCVQCGLCADVCWKGALEVSPVVSIDQLFDFEPVTFNLHTPKKSPKYFG